MKRSGGGETSGVSLGSKRGVRWEFDCCVLSLCSRVTDCCFSRFFLRQRSLDRTVFISAVDTRSSSRNDGRGAAAGGAAAGRRAGPSFSLMGGSTPLSSDQLRSATLPRRDLVACLGLLGGMGTILDSPSWFWARLRTRCGLCLGLGRETPALDLFGTCFIFYEQII